MARLIYAAIASLDGFVNDERGEFDWAAPDEQVHAFVNDLERDIGTYLYGRRMYEVMQAWETMDLADEPHVMLDYAAIWRSARKVVFSRTLSQPSTEQTTIEPEFDPALIARMKRDARADISIGGPTIAAAALRAGLVDELHLLAHPIAVGGGTHWLPRDVALPMRLLDERRFDSGVVHLHYEILPA